MLEISDQTISIAVSLLCISLGTVFWIYRQSSRSTTKQSSKLEGELKYPPSPPERHWLWKHGAALAGDGVSSHDIIFLQWMEKLNSKVVMFDIPVLGRLITVGDADLAQHVLQSKAKDGKVGGSAFPKSPTYSNVIPLIGTKSIVIMEGSEWAHQRKVFNPGFSPNYLKGIVTTIAQKCDRFLEFCETQDIANGTPTDMCARAIDLTSDVIAQVAFGEDWGYNSKEDNGGIQTLGIFRDLTKLIADGMKNPLQKLNPFYKRKISKLSKSLDQDMQRLVRRRIDSVQNENDNNSKSKKDILSLSLTSVLKANADDRKSRAKDENHSSKNTAKKNLSSSDYLFSDDDMECMTSQLKTFYFAGHDTTATTIAWAFWSLVMNPEALQKARDEVLEHLGKDWVDAVAKGNSHEKIIPKESTTYENLQKCQYLDAITRETLRLYPPAASTRYSIYPEASFGDYKIGQCIVELNFYAIQRDPDIWGKDANDFCPERFLGEAGREKINSFGFLPFSKGSRDCIGKYFALLESKIALAALITRYDASVVDADKEVYTARLTSVPKNGCLVKLARRSGEGSSS
jgi:cytochrome P450